MVPMLTCGLTRFHVHRPATRCQEERASRGHVIRAMAARLRWYVNSSCKEKKTTVKSRQRSRDSCLAMDALARVQVCAARVGAPVHHTKHVFLAALQDFVDDDLLSCFLWAAGENAVAQPGWESPSVNPLKGIPLPPAMPPLPPA